MLYNVRYELYWPYSLIQQMKIHSSDDRTCIQIEIVYFYIVLVGLAM